MMVLQLVHLEIQIQVVEHFVLGPGKAGGNKNTFNVDDVGYANASDVNMNAGAFNSYNTDQTWSSGLSGSGSGGSFAEATTGAFDGDKNTRARWTGTADPVLTATLPTAISATKLRIKVSLLGFYFGSK